MKREDKGIIIDQLTEKLNEAQHFYLTDTSELDAENTSKLRRECFKNDIQLIVVKNTLLQKAMEKAEKEFEPLYETLKGSTSIMFTTTGNAPGKLIKEFRKSLNKPILKGAFVEESFYVGDDQIEALATIKSKEELIGDVITLLQSPMKNVVSALQSGGGTIHGILQTLGERE